MASPTLYSAIKIDDDLELPNRIAMAPMTRGRAIGENDFIASPTMAEYYKQRASVGLIITEGTFISELAEGWWRAPRIFTEKHAEAWKATTEAVHKKGGKIFCQLWHCGRSSHSSFRPHMKDGRGVSPSPIGQGKEHRFAFTPVGRVDHEVPREITVEEIEKLPGEYKNAAEMAKRAGFDGVEIHSANGYLLDSFLQSCTNQRTDKYGGSFENRTRLLLKIIEAVCEVYPSSRVGVRISPNGVYNGMGCPEYRELFLYVAQQLNQCKLGYLHIMIGLGFGFHEQGTPMVLSEFREVYKGTIMANCGYDQKSAEEDVTKGNADMISFGRPLISNPDLVERFRKGIELTPPPREFLYSAAGENLGGKGYTDYPAAQA